LQRTSNDFALGCRAPSLSQQASTRNGPCALISAEAWTFSTCEFLIFPIIWHKQPQVLDSNAGNQFEATPGAELFAVFATSFLSIFVTLRSGQVRWAAEDDGVSGFADLQCSINLAALDEQTRRAQ
jgi:hypothetical protein